MTASCHALLAGLAGVSGSGLSSAERTTEADRAIDALRQAVESGFREFNIVRTHEYLDPLRDRDDFRMLMMDVAFPAQAFAAGS